MAKHLLLSFWFEFLIWVSDLMKSLKYACVWDVSINLAMKWNILFCIGQRPREIVKPIQNSSGFPFCWKDRKSFLFAVLFLFCFAIWLQNWNLFTEVDFQVLLHKAKGRFWWGCLCHAGVVLFLWLLSCAHLVLFLPPFLKLGTRHILEVMQAAGHDITTLFLCGGLSKNPLFVQMHADITGKRGEVQGKEAKYFYFRCLSPLSLEK